jgi:hypothetical protein
MLTARAPKKLGVAADSEKKQSNDDNRMDYIMAVVVDRMFKRDCVGGLICEKICCGDYSSNTTGGWLLYLGWLLHPRITQVATNKSPSDKVFFNAMDLLSAVGTNRASCCRCEMQRSHHQLIVM